MPYQHRKAAYQRKLEALVGLSNQWQIRIDDDEWPELNSLLKTFSEFARDYIKLIERIPAKIARPQFALNQGIDKLLNEWSVLSRACKQRIENSQGAPNNGLPSNLKTSVRVKVTGT